MSKQITVTIPARTVKLSRETKRFPARVETLTQDDAGQWYVAFGGTQERITEAEAIDVAIKGSNWDAIRREHFPMAGFHS
jgi:hypothetical protein